jgi:hypothetical protein
MASGHQGWPRRSAVTVLCSVHPSELAATARQAQHTDTCLALPCCSHQSPLPLPHMATYWPGTGCCRPGSDCTLHTATHPPPPHTHMAVCWASTGCCRPGSDCTLPLTQPLPPPPPQGYVLGQYGLLHALEHQQDVARLLILNTPLAVKTKLRPELAAYKNPLPFLRPGSKPFDGYNYNASGSPYAMQARDAEVYGTPYQTSPEASVAVAETMDKVS